MNMTRSFILLALASALASNCPAVVVSGDLIKIGLANTIDGVDGGNGMIGRNNFIGEAGDNQFIVGQYNTFGEENETAFAFGENNSVGNEDDIIFLSGYNNRAGGTINHVIGGYNYASGYYNFAIGRNNSVSRNYTSALGHGLITNQNYEIVLGRYNEMTPTSGEPERVLVVGNGNGIENDPQERSNALIVYQSGDVSVQGVLRCGDHSDDIGMGPFNQ